MLLFQIAIMGWSGGKYNPLALEREAYDSREKRETLASDSRPVVYVEISRKSSFNPHNKTLIWLVCSVTPSKIKIETI